MGEETILKKKRFSIRFDFKRFFQVSLDVENRLRQLVKRNFQKLKPKSLYTIFLITLLASSGLYAQDRNIESETNIPHSGKYWLLKIASTTSIEIIPTDQLELTPNNEILTEDDIDPIFDHSDKFQKKLNRYSKESVIAVIFFPPVNPKTAKNFCRQLIQRRPQTDLILMINGDEITGHIKEIKNRILALEIDEELIFLPLSRVRAICFAELPEKRNL